MTIELNTDDQSATGDTNEALETTQGNDQGKDEVYKKLLDIELKKAKAALDRAYAERDKERSEKAALLQAAQDAEIKRLEQDGKAYEALQAKLAQAEARAVTLSNQLDSRNRDDVVNQALRGVPFRSAKLAALAAQEITSQLVKDRDGNWVHRSGASIQDYIKTYVAEDENSDMFAPKTSSGTGLGITPGSTQTVGGSANQRPKSVLGLSGAQVLELAKKGMLPNQG